MPHNKQYEVNTTLVLDGLVDCYIW